MRVSLSPRAEQDLEDILLYTEQTWGADQSERYQDDLLQAMLSLIQFPNLGRPVPHLGTGTRALTVNVHLLVYRVVSEEVVIARIVHGRRGPSIDIDD